MTNFVFSGWRFSDMMTIAPENLQCEIPPFKPSSTESRHEIGFAFLAGRTFKDIHPRIFLTPAHPKSPNLIETFEIHPHHPAVACTFNDTSTGQL